MNPHGFLNTLLLSIGWMYQSLAVVLGISIREISIFFDTSRIVSYSIPEFTNNTAVSAKILHDKQIITHCL